MNTNSKYIKRVFKLFLFLTLLSSFTYAKVLEKNSEILIPIELKENSFIKGNYEFSNFPKSFELLDNKKRFVKKLDNFNQLDSSFYFINNSEKNYFLYLKTGVNAVDYSIDIEKILPTNYDLNEKEELLSEIIKKQKKALNLSNDTNAFWKKVKKIGTPLIEPLGNDKYILTFLYRGAKHNVRLLGGPVADHVLLNRLGQSDIWYKSFEVKKGIRMSYKLAPDVPNVEGTWREKRIAILATAQKDPLNKKPYILLNNEKQDKYSQYSTFEILDDDFIDYSKEMGNKKGLIKKYEIKSKRLKNRRRIDIYTPSDFDKTKEYGLLFVFDGVDYQVKADIPRMLDNLIAQKKIKQTIAVFIDNPSRTARSKELPCNDDFAYFMAKELLPFVQNKTNLKFNPKNTILTGSSYGGLASLFVAFKYPEYFKNVLSQSGSFWWGEKKDNEPEWLTRYIASSNKKDLKLYLNAGIYETGYFSIDILESNRHLRTVLNSKKYDLKYNEFIGGHDYFAWRVELAKGLLWFK